MHNTDIFFAGFGKRNLEFFLWGVLMLMPLSALGQHSDESARYRNILQSLAQKDIAAALVKSRSFLAQVEGYEQLYDKLVQTAKAADQLPQTRDLFLSQLEQSPPNPRGHYGLGLIFNAEGNLPEAIESFKTCFRQAPEFAASLLALVDVCRASKQDLIAETHLKSLVLSAPGNYAAHLGLGYYHARKRQVELALPELAAAKRLRPDSVAVCYYKALALQLGGRYSDSAAEIAQNSLLIKNRANEEEQQAFLNVTAINFYQLGDYGQAASTFRAAIELARKLDDKGYEEVSLAYLASVDEARDDYQAALEGYRQALATAKQSLSPGSAINMRRYPGRIGSIYFAVGDWQMAHQYFHSGLDHAREVKDRALEGLLLTYLGDLRAAQQDFAGAADYYKQVVNLGVEDPFSPGSAPDVLSQLYLQQGEYNQAKGLIESELQSANATNQFARQLKLLNRLGETQLRLDDPAAAIETYQQALRLALARDSTRQIWVAYAGLAACHARRGRAWQARDLYLQALQVMESVRARLKLSEDKAGFLQDKVEVYQKLLGLQVELERENTWQGNVPDSFRTAERARARAFVDLLTEAKIDLERALRPDLLNRKQVIQQRLSSLTASLLREKAVLPEKQNHAEIARLESELGKADDDLGDWLRGVKKQHPEYAALTYPEAVNLPQTQRLLAPDQVLLAYSLGAEESYLFAVSRDSYQVWKLAVAEQLNNQAGKLLAALTDERGEASVWQDAAAQLYQQLIQPAVKFLRQRPATRELIIVPDGALHRVPFEVLLEPMPRPITNATKLPYLVKRYALSYAPSATVLKSLKESRQNPVRKPKELIVFADPQYGQAAAQQPAALAILRAAGNEQQWKFGRLFNSAREAQGIAQVFAAKGGAELYLREQANEEEVKSPNDRLLGYRVVHFSAHGLVNERRPRFSGLVLTLPRARQTDEAPAGDDGILSAYEIFNLKLNAELVTLSACETGLGKQVKGEGLMSLVRAFMYAGTPSVLASLWKVDDAGTADLMIDFYRFWQDGKRNAKKVIKLNKAAALRQAQLKAIASGSQPFYWAPFVLVGRSN